MTLVSEQRSALNPNAPLFIPSAFQLVEDFSPKWWELVKTSTWFRDYWISQHQDDDFGGSVENATKEYAMDMLPEADQFENLFFSSEAECFIHPAGCEPHNAGRTQNGINLDAKALLKKLVTPKASAEPPKFHVKPVQHVAVRRAPRWIQQPR